MWRLAFLTWLLFAAGTLALAPGGKPQAPAAGSSPEGVQNGGASPRRITFSPENETWPVWDPAGDRIAYLIGSANRGFSSAGSGGSIGLAASDGSTETVAALGPDVSPFGFAISPSWVGDTGQLMVGEKVDLHEYLTFDVSQAPFVREARDGGDEAFALKLVAAPQPGSPGLGSGDSVAVSRDGSTVAWRISRRAGCGLTQIRSAPFSELSGQFAHEAGTVLLEGECESVGRPLFVDGFSLTPDGSQLVISLPPAGNTESFPPLDLYAYNTDGSGLAGAVTVSGVEQGFSNRFPDVSPDGTRVLFNRGTGVEDAIYSIGLNGVGLIRMVDSGREPTWAPDGQSIAFTDLSPDDDPPNTDIFVVDLSGQPGPFVPPAPDLDTLRDAFVDSNFNDVPEPGADTRLIFERQGNTIRLFEADNPNRVWIVVCGDPHPLTGRPQSCVVDPPAFPAPTTLWQRLKRIFTRTVMGVDAARHIISIDRFDSNLRATSLVIESEISGEDVRLTTITAVDEDRDGVTNAFEGSGFLLLPSFRVDPLLVDVTGDGNADYAGWPITFEGGRYFLPLADSNGDSVPDTTLSDFDRDGRPDPDTPLVAQFLTGPPPGPSQLQLQFAQFGDGEAPQGDASLFSQIALFNLDDAQPANAEIVIRDDAGQPLEVDLDGEQIAGTASVRIPPGGVRFLKTDGVGEARSGSVVVTSDRALGGNVLFGGTTGLAGVGISHVMAGGFTAAIETDSSLGINTGVAVMNLESTPATVRFRLFDPGGVQLAESLIDPLAAGGHRALFVTQLPWQTDGSPLDFSEFHGILEAETAGLLGATVLQTRPAELATLPVAPRAASRGQLTVSRRANQPKTPGEDLFQKIYFAQFGDGQQRSGDGQVLANLLSQIVLLNLSSEPALVRIVLRDDEGNPLAVDLNGEPAAGMRELVIPAGGLQVLRTDGVGDLVVGSVVVCSDQQIAGTILFGGSAGTAGVGASAVLRHGFLAPVESLPDRSLRTGIAVMNLQTEVLRLDLRVRDAAGATLATAVLEIPPLGHRARFVDELNAVLAGSNVQGVLEATGSGKYAATVIRTTRGLFATQPVVPTLR